MMIAGVAWVFVCILSETYSPTILNQKARLRRKETGDDRYWSRYDDRKISLPRLLKINLSRPFVMIITEPIWYTQLRSSSRPLANCAPVNQFILGRLCRDYLRDPLSLLRGLSHCVHRYSWLVSGPLRPGL
jgi:hypothetical protein